MHEDVLFVQDMESHPKAAFNLHYFPKAANISRALIMPAVVLVCE